MNNEGIDYDDIVEKVPLPQSIDLVEKIRILLTGAGLIKEANLIFMLDPLVQASIGQHAYVQRPNLNKYFLYQLSQFGSESIEERYCLIDDGTPEEWLRLFEGKILPFLITKRLPVLLN